MFKLVNLFIFYQFDYDDTGKVHYLQHTEKNKFIQSHRTEEDSLVFWKFFLQKCCYFKLNVKLEDQKTYLPEFQNFD